MRRDKNLERLPTRSLRKVGYTEKLRANIKPPKNRSLRKRIAAGILGGLLIPGGAMMWDSDGDGFGDIEETYGPLSSEMDPKIPDVFLELDSIQFTDYNGKTEIKALTGETIQKVKNAFAEQGIKLHLRLGGLAGLKRDPAPTYFNFNDVRNVSQDSNHFNPVMRGVSQYGLIGGNLTIEGYSSPGGQAMQPGDLMAINGAETSGTILHEIGHNFGLEHDKDPRSLMNNLTDDERKNLTDKAEESDTYLPHQWKYIKEKGMKLSVYASRIRNFIYDWTV